MMMVCMYLHDIAIVRRDKLYDKITLIEFWSQKKDNNLLNEPNLNIMLYLKTKLVLKTIP